MNKMKLNILIVIFITILLIPFAINVYSEIKLEQLENTKEDTFNKSLRFDLQLDDKEYYYKDIDDDISGYINGKDQNLKYSSYTILDNSEYVTTKINEKKARLYCYIPIDKGSKDYIRSFGINSTIDVDSFNDNNIVLIAIEKNQKLSCYILDLNNKSIIWTMGNDFDDAYYNTSNDTVVCTRNIHPTDGVWGKMKYENFEVNMYGEISNLASKS
ncbi:hypothetical protein [Clostridium saccharoperbutylacetonicum]|uniref:hypothetical protein n=1 Tax=Clostridium saccharoperbutylacetonicum TaxID=36745 RepID=UPI0039E7DFD6